MIRGLFASLLAILLPIAKTLLETVIAGLNAAIGGVGIPNSLEAVLLYGALAGLVAGFGWLYKKLVEYLGAR